MGFVSKGINTKDCEWDAFTYLLLLTHHLAFHPLVRILYCLPSKVTGSQEQSNAVEKVMKLNVEAPNG